MTFMAAVMLTAAIDLYALPHIGQSDGLASSRVYSVLKDSEGYMWFSTRTGACRYDGTSFETYDFSFRGMVVDSEGRLLAFTESGEIYSYSKETRSFSHLVSLPTTRLHILYVGNDDVLIAGTVNGLFKVSKDGRYDKIKDGPSVDVHDICTGKNGVIYLAARDGLYRLLNDGDDFRVEDMNLTKYRLQSLHFDSAYDRLWIGTYSEGLFLLKGNQLEKVFNVTDRYPIRSICDVSSDEIWVGTDGYGIYSLDKANNDVKRHLSTRTQRESDRIDGNGVYSLFQDGGLVWICTFTGGVNVYDPNHFSFDIITPSDKHVNSVIESSDGRIWYATYNGISRFDPAKGSWKNFLQAQMEDDENNVVISMTEDDEGNIWAGGFAMGAVKIDSRTDVVSKVPFGTDGIELEDIYSVACDPDGGIWFGGILGRITRYDRLKKQFRSFPVSDALTVKPIPGKRVLVATNDGFYIVRYDSGEIEHIPTIDTEDPQSSHVTCFLYKSESMLYLGTEGGIILYNLEKKMMIGRVTIIPPQKFRFVNSILEDRFGRLWFSTESGLVCHDFTTGMQISATGGEGIPSDSFTRNSGLACSDGSFIFGTNIGAIRFNPEDIHLARGEYPCYITYAKVSKRNDFNASFACLDFKRADRLSYRWKLVGHDKSWSDYSSNCAISYNGLKRGRYTLEVESYVNSIFNSRIQHNFIIKPHPMLSFWAFSVYSIFAVLIVFIVLGFQKKTLEAKNSDDKIKFFINVAHEIRTPVTLIKIPLDNIRKKEHLSAQGEKYITLAQKNADRIVHIVDQLLDFQKTERSAMNLRIQETVLNHFVSEHISEFEEEAGARNVILAASFPKLDCKVWTDREKLGMILDNLLSNAIKFSHQGGRVSVSVSFGSDEFSIKVEDNGIGIPSADQKKIFSRFFRAQNAENSMISGSGIGLALSKSLTELLHGSISYSPNSPAGSVFSVTFPIGREQFLPADILLEKSLVSPVKHASDGVVKAEVLVVEDNDELRDYLMQNLGEVFSVSAAGDGVEALSMIRQKAPDIVVSDILMPRMQGDALCRSMKNDSSLSHIPIILLTAVTGRDKILSGFEIGADDYVEKPFDVDILIARIQSILRARMQVNCKEVGITAHEQEMTDCDDESLLISNVECCIKSHIDDSSFGINELCAEFAMSRSVFYKKIKAQCGKSPSDFIREIRLRYAAELLDSGKYSVARIATMAGFDDPKYFSTSFRKHFGVSPSQYRLYQQ